MYPNAEDLMSAARIYCTGLKLYYYLYVEVGIGGGGNDSKDKKQKIRDNREEIPEETVSVNQSLSSSSEHRFIDDKGECIIYEPWTWPSEKKPNGAGL